MPHLQMWTVKFPEHEVTIPVDNVIWSACVSSLLAFVYKYQYNKVCQIKFWTIYPFGIASDVFDDEDATVIFLGRALPHHLKSIPLTVALRFYKYQKQKIILSYLLVSLIHSLLSSVAISVLKTEIPPCWAIGEWMV